jgi:hypothetical protein
MYETLTTTEPDSNNIEENLNQKEKTRSCTPSQRTSKCHTKHCTPTERTSKLWHNPCQIGEKAIDNNQKEPDLSIHQTLNKPKKPERGTANQEQNKVEDPSTKTTPDLLTHQR